MATHQQDDTAATAQLPATLEEFFTTKTARDVEGTMAFFAPDLAGYLDATLGWDFGTYASLKAVFEKYMPTWAPPARSYATRILAGKDSALVHMTDTPELFGGELRILAAADFADGKIVRWIDYWDSTAFDSGLYDQLRRPADSFPTDLRDGQVETRADATVVKAATTLHQAWAAGDPSAAAAAMHPDVVLADMAMRTITVGRIDTTRYLERALEHVPYGRASTLRHIVGGRSGGGFEWTAGPGASQLAGITSLELDPDGLITIISSVYDSRQLDPARKRELLVAAAG